MRLLLPIVVLVVAAIAVTDIVEVGVVLLIVVDLEQILNHAKFFSDLH